MKVLKAFAVALILMTVSFSSFAQDKPKKDLNPWIDCGIGAMLFPDTTWAAVVSNIIWDLGTTAVTSDQSSQNTCNSKKATMAMYIGATYANLSEETVKGDGKYLHAMLDVAGCDASVHGAVIGSLRSDFAQYVSKPSYAGMTKAAQAEGYYNMVEKTVQGACRV